MCHDRVDAKEGFETQRRGLGGYIPNTGLEKCSKALLVALSLHKLEAATESGYTRTSLAEGQYARYLRHIAHKICII
jgi:hypothetical protein